MAGAFSLRSRTEHPEGPKAMSDIVIRCPVLGTPVPTGLRTDTIRFASLPNMPFGFGAQHARRCTNGDRRMRGYAKTTIKNPQEALRLGLARF